MTNRIFKFVGAMLLGMVAGMIVVMAIEAINMVRYPPPKGMNLQDPQAFKEHAKSLPKGAFLVVALAWTAGSFAAAYVARRLSPDRMLLPALLSAGCLFAASLINLLMIPSPIWFWIVGLAGCAIGGHFGAALAAPRVYSFESTRQLNAPLSRVFQILSQVEEFSKAVPGIDKVEIISDIRHGVGTRFLESRTIQGRSATAELNVTEYDENQKIRLDSDSMGIHWSTLFEVQTLSSGKVELKMRTDAEPRSFIAQQFMPLMLGMVRSAIEQDVKSIHRYAEQT